MAKRLFDFIVSFILLIGVSPILIVVALMVWIMMGSPVLFKQHRPGLYGKPFIMYKFRTMTNKRDAAGCLLSDEARLTKVGKFLRHYSLDELPQLFNVIKGDLSLVGPRPLLMEYIPLYNSEQARRHEVKPGITGWAQVNGRNAISWDEKFKLDVWYVDNQSFWLDMKILWMTIVKVFKREGISQEGQATMEQFKGGRIMSDRFKDWEHPEIEEGKLTKYNWLVQNKDGLQLGYKTDIGAFTYINAKNGVVIEDFVQIGSHCSIYSISTIDGKEGMVVLKKNCKIGSHSVIMPGVTIGENSIIGAYSFVNKDIPTNVIAFGVPAKVKGDVKKDE